MQYILSQEEFDALVEKSERDEKKYQADLQKLCTLCADNIPISGEWGVWKDTPTPWGCILTDDDWYCDKCPVQDMCPNKYKQWSK